MLVKTESVENLGPWTKDGATVYAVGQDFEYGTCENEFTLYYLPMAPLIFLDPRPTDRELDTIYPKEYIPFSFNQLTGLVGWARAFLQERKAKVVLKLAPRGDILDAGCGSGGLLLALSRLRGGVSGLFANDFSETIISPLRRLGFGVIVGRLNDLVTNKSFDVICLNQVIEHLPDPWAAISNLTNLLKPGGYLFIETPSFDALDAKIFHKKYWGGYHIPRHFFIFNQKSLSRTISEAGLSVVSISYIVNPIFWIQSLHHYLLDRGHKRLAILCNHRNVFLMGLFTIFDLCLLVFYGKTSNMRLIARNP